MNVRYRSDQHECLPQKWSTWETATEGINMTVRCRSDRYECPIQKWSTWQADTEKIDNCEQLIRTSVSNIRVFNMFNHYIIKYTQDLFALQSTRCVLRQTNSIVLKTWQQRTKVIVVTNLVRSVNIEQWESYCCIVAQHLTPPEADRLVNAQQLPHMMTD